LSERGKKVGLEAFRKEGGIRKEKKKVRRVPEKDRGVRRDREIVNP